MADPAPSVSIGTGLTVVTATAPVLTAAENDLFCARGQAIPIASRQSPTQITLQQPWPVASLVGEPAFSILSLGEYWRSAISINKRFADLLSKWEVVNPFKFDAAGTLAQRDGYNNQPKGFVYISFDPLPVRVFIKLANTNSSADWSAPIYIGSGGQVEYQEALDQERQQRIQADAAISTRIDNLAAGADPGVRADLNAEIARSTGKDAQHDTQIAGLRSDLTAEASTRGAKDAAHDVRIDNEAAARTSADIATNARVDTEVNARLAADANLAARGDAEEAARKAADAVLGTRLTTAEGDIDALDLATKLVRAVFAEMQDQGFRIRDGSGGVVANFDGAGATIARLLLAGVLDLKPTASGDFRVLDGFGGVAASIGPNGLTIAQLLLDGVLQMRATASGGYRIRGQNGEVAFAIERDGVYLPGMRVASGRYPGVPWYLRDPDGGVPLYLTDKGVLHVAAIQVGTNPGGGAYTQAEIDALNGRAMSTSRDIMAGPTNTKIMRPVCEYNLYKGGGQSLLAGQEANPALSRTPIADLLMLGDSVRSISGDYTDYQVVGASVLNPLVATNQDRGTGRILSDAETAALPVGANVFGESPLEGALRFARRLHLQHHGIAADPSRRWIAGNVAVPGSNIQQLQKGQSFEQYNRAIDWANKVKSAVQAENPGATICLAARLWTQGQADYALGTTEDTYMSLFRKLLSDENADITTGILGQTDPAAVFMTQTGGEWARDGVAIGMAQFRLSLEDPGIYLIGPDSPVTNRAGGHQDSNGTRWIGAQTGKVMHRVLVQGLGWRPTSPLWAMWRRNTLLCAFHSPCGKLRFRDPYVQHATKFYKNRGFRIIDALGVAEIASVKLVGEQVVQFICTRDLVGPVRLTGGEQTEAEGNVCLCDSDTTISFDSYEVRPGDDPLANIPALVGKSYDLGNWCIAFNIQAEAK